MSSSHRNTFGEVEEGASEKNLPPFFSTKLPVFRYFVSNPRRKKASKLENKGGKVAFLSIKENYCRIESFHPIPTPSNCFVSPTFWDLNPVTLQSPNDCCRQEKDRKSSVLSKRQGTFFYHFCNQILLVFSNFIGLRQY